VILLPEEGTFTAFEDTLDYETVTDILDTLEVRNTQLTMPKFGFTSEFSLKEALSASSCQMLWKFPPASFFLAPYPCQFGHLFSPQNAVFKFLPL
jgi:hypothetical protein